MNRNNKRVINGEAIKLLHFSFITMRLIMSNTNKKGKISNIFNWFKEENEYTKKRLGMENENPIILSWSHGIRMELRANRIPWLVMNERISEQLMIGVLWLSLG